MESLIIFAYETGDSDCRYWQDFVIAKSDKPIDFDMLEDSIMSYMASTVSDGKEYTEMTEEIMNASDYAWYFLDDRAVSIRKVYTFWI